MRAEVIRGVFIRGKAYPEGAIVEISKLEFLELRSYNYVKEAAPAPAEPGAELALEAPAQTGAAAARGKAARG